MNGINGYTVWYRLEVAVHHYSYLIIKNNNYNELPTFLMYVILLVIDVWYMVCIAVRTVYRIKRTVYTVYRINLYGTQL